jgi:hypothetical protein
MNVRYNVKQGIPPGFLDDVAQVMQGIRRLGREAIHILCAHDQEVFATYPLACSKEVYCMICGVVRRGP